jgi:hypothetical protein
MHGVAWALHYNGRVLLLKGDLDRAEWVLRESVRHFHHIEDLDGAANTLVLLAEIAQARGQIEQAMRLLSAAASRKPNPLNVTNLPPEWQAAHRRAITDARVRSSDPALSQAWAKGQDIERVIAMVLAPEAT